MAGSSRGHRRFRGNYEQFLEDSPDSNDSTTSSPSPVRPMSAPSSGQDRPFMGFQQQRPANSSQAQAYLLGRRPRPPASQTQTFAPSPGTCRLPPIGRPCRPSPPLHPQGPSNNRCTSTPEQPLNNCWSASCRAGEQFAKELLDILNRRRQNNTDFGNAGVEQEEEEENLRSIPTIEKEQEAVRQRREIRKEF